MFFQNIRNFILENKKIMFFLFFLVVILFPENSFATTADGESEVGFFDILNGGIAIIAGFLGLLTQFVGIFMSPEWTNGSFIGFDENLKKLWVMMSNVVYMIFAFLLIWIALMNILGKGGEWELKQAIPKFIGGVLIVPFSWFFVNAMISLASIMMTSIITLPYESFPNDFGKAGEVQICKDFIVNLGESADKEVVKCNKDTMTTLEKFFKEGKSLGSIISIYTYGIMNIDALGQLKGADLSSIKTILDMGVKGIMDLLIIIVYFILMVALAIALFVRGIYIWLFLVFSPLFGLMFYFGDKGGEALKKFSVKEFVALALVPVYVGAALAFGLLFIFVAGEGLVNNSKSIEQTANGSDKITYGEFSLTINGSVLDQNNPIQKSFAEAVMGLKGSISYMLMQIFGIAILRIAVMAALKTSTITENVTKPIADFGDSVGNLAMKAPTYAPIIPTPGGGTMSAKSLGTFGTNMASNIDSHFQKKGSALSEKFSPNLDNTQKAINNLATSGVNDFRDTSFSKIEEYAIKAIKDLKTASNKDQFNKLVDEMKKRNILTEKSNLDYNKRNQNEFATDVFNAVEPKVKARSGGQLSDLPDYQKIFDSTKTETPPVDKSKTESKVKLDNADDVGKAIAGVMSADKVNLEDLSNIYKNVDQTKFDQTKFLKEMKTIFDSAQVGDDLRLNGAYTYEDLEKFIKKQK